MDWKPLLAYITGSVDQELLLRNEYLVAENRILRNQITGARPAERWGAQDAGRDWQETGEEGPGGSGQPRQT